jgi:hypothetical protein
MTPEHVQLRAAGGLLRKITPHRSPSQQLWLTVIEHAILDLRDKPAHRRSALEFFRGPDFPGVCDAADLHADFVLRLLEELGFDMTTAHKRNARPKPSAQ